MPNAREFGLSSADYSANVSVSPWNVTVTDDGKTNFYNNTTVSPTHSSYVTKTVSGTIFPASGYRDRFGTHYQTAMYLSSSPYVGANIAPQGLDSVYVMTASTVVIPLNRTSLSTQAPVRCVRTDAMGDARLVPITTVDVEDWEDGGTYGDSTGATAGQGDIWY
jgi:hypothetical protein